MASKNSFGAATPLRVGDATYQIFRLAKLEETGKGNVSRLPFSIKILLAFAALSPEHRLHPITRTSKPSADLHDSRDAPARTLQAELRP